MTSASLIAMPYPGGPAEASSFSVRRFVSAGRCPLTRRAGGRTLRVACGMSPTHESPAGRVTPLREEETMYPGMMYWWKTHRHGGGCHAAHYGHGEHRHGLHRHRSWRAYESAAHGDAGASAFGVRRPLRFLAYKLDLDEQQVTELARILDDLKTERAQAEVDARRSMAAFADALSGETFDGAKAAAAGAVRVASAEHLRDAVTAALARLHALLDAPQRERLAHLIRSGALQI
jgi:Spy/CpxP family protein refolding chaperone